MREIKFRVWDKENKEMLEWDQLKEEATFDWLVDKHLTFMQYTGLKDKNGVEIYEGDIIKTGGDVAKVEYNILYSQNRLVFKNHSTSLNVYHQTDYEVLGDVNRKGAN